MPWPSLFPSPQEGRSGRTSAPGAAGPPLVFAVAACVPPPSQPPRPYLAIPMIGINDIVETSAQVQNLDTPSTSGNPGQPHP